MHIHGRNYEWSVNLTTCRSAANERSGLLIVVQELRTINQIHKVYCLWQDSFQLI
ncbi:hypothetical protein SAMN05216387_105180 [Nitrosovibrio tenuis]|uniref:Uncharacterized protein n=1 Tax=Nitrosovibrio tenuis TaxID=1233 RepID=A0A1H7MR78_9PROT|nr:hypothetical protein SAMN05216387_105180 [Nitrosovibrio tenuis]